MTKRLGLWMVFGVLLAASVGASKAQAQFLSGGGYGLGFFNYGNSSYMDQRIPYYALYPPVYYSYPVARTYGYSPFAYPPGTMTPQVAPQVEAATYINPYVTPRVKPAAKQPSADRSVDARTPANRGTPVRVARTYINPFVQAASASSEALTSRTDR